MTKTAQKQALDVLTYFTNDRAARQSLGLRDSVGQEYIESAEALVALVAAIPSPSAAREHLAVLRRLLEQQFDGRAEILAERTLTILQLVTSIDAETARSFRHVRHTARARRLVAYFERMTAEQGGAWRAGLEGAQTLLQLTTNQSASALEYDALLASLEPELQRKGSVFAELVSACREGREHAA